MSQAQLDQLQTVNTRFNAIPYDGLPGPGEAPDWWTDIPVAGDSFVCRDYVLAKSNALGDEGWTSDQLSVILCWTEVVSPPTDPSDPTSGRAYHAVLCAIVDGVDWILDSRFDDIYQMTKPPADYQWDRRQVAGTTQFENIG